MKLHLKSFAGRLVFYIVTITCIIFACIAIVFFSFSIDREEQQAIEFSHSQLNISSTKMESKLLQVEKAIGLMQPELEMNRNNPTAIKSILRRIIITNTEVMGAAVAFKPYQFSAKEKWHMDYSYIDSTKTIRYKKLGSETYNYFTQSWYTDAINNRNGIWTEPYYNQSGSNMIMITYSLPMIDHFGQTYAVITADVSVKSLLTYIDKSKQQTNGKTFILSSKGLFILHPDTNLILRTSISNLSDSINVKEFKQIGSAMLHGESGTRKFIENGKPMIAFYSPVPLLRWSVCNVCSYSSIMRGLYGTTILVVTILLCGLVLLICSILWLVKHETKPLKVFVEASKKIAEGRLDEPMPTIDTSKEMQSLHDSFVNMSTSLKKYIEDLKVTTAENERIANELSIARDIQMNMLPKIFPPFPNVDEIDLFAKLIPAKEVGGDLYEFHVSNDKLFFAIGDVSGKGIPASLFMAITQSLYRSVASHSESPAYILSAINQFLTEGNDINMFVTMFTGVLNLNDGTLTYCNAGHEAPLIKRPGKEAEIMKIKPNIPLGLFDFYDFQEESIIMDHNCKLLVYTDGVTETENEQKETFGQERFLETVKEKERNNPQMTPKELIEGIEQSLGDYTGYSKPIDDITMLSITFKGSNRHMVCKKEMSIANEMEELTRMENTINDLSKACNWSEKMSMHINLALEEILSNIISYAYPKDIKGPIDISIICYDSDVIIKITDNGIPFNPMARNATIDTSIPGNKRSVKELGIFLAKKLMTGMHYQRRDGKNCLYMKKKIE